jgi:hypothetical protein
VGGNRVAHELGQARKLGVSNRKLEKDVEGRGKSRGGKGGIYGCRESSEAHACARSPIGRPLNSGGQTRELR